MQEITTDTGMINLELWQSDMTDCFYQVAGLLILMAIQGEHPSQWPSLLQRCMWCVCSCLFLCACMQACAQVCMQVCGANLCVSFKHMFTNLSILNVELRAHYSNCLCERKQHKPTLNLNRHPDVAHEGHTHLHSHFIIFNAFCQDLVDVNLSKLNIFLLLSVFSSVCLYAV